MNDKKVKLLQIGKYYAPVKGGIETYLYNLCRNLPSWIETKVMVSNLSMRTEMDMVEGIEVLRLAKLDQLFSTALNPSMPLWLRRERPDIVNVQLPNPMAVLSYLIARPPGKLIVTYHSDILKQKFAFTFYRRFLEYFLSLAEAIIVATPNHIEYSPVLNKFRSKCRVVHFGIDSTIYTPNAVSEGHAASIREKYGPKPLVLFVGRLVYYKGLDYLVKAVRGLDVNLLIIGNGPYYSTLKFQSMDDPNIHLLGEIPDSKIAGYYNAADFFVLPSVSRAEAFGLVQLEAFTAGLPVICTNLTTGVPYVNVDGETGLVVPPCDSVALGKAIQTLAADPEMRKRMGRAAVERVTREFDIRNMVDGTVEIYREVLGMKKDSVIN